MIPVPNEQLISLRVWAYDKATEQNVDRPEKRANDIIDWLLSNPEGTRSLTPVLESGGPALEEDLVPVQ